MKFKKVFAGLALIAALFLTGCSEQKSTGLSIEQVITIAKKDMKNVKSAKLNEDITMTLSGEKRKMTGTATFSFAAIPVMHSLIDTTVKTSTGELVTVKAEQWFDKKNTYSKSSINGKTSKWGKQALPAETSEEMNSSEMMPQIYKDLDKKITKVAKVKEAKGVTTLTAKITDANFLSDYLAKGASASSSNPAFGSTKALGQQFKLKQLSFKMTVKNKKLASYAVTMALSEKGNSNTSKFTMIFSDFGKYDGLKIPNTVLKAKKTKDMING